MFVIFCLEAPTIFSRTIFAFEVDDFPPVLEVQDSGTFPANFVIAAIWLPEAYHVGLMHMLEATIPFAMIDLFTELIKN